MSLSRTSLSVSENCAVVALKHVRDDRRCGFLINGRLLSFITVCKIKSELLWLFLGERLVHEDFSTSWSDLDGFRVALALFLAVHGSASDADANCLILLLDGGLLHI